jgi:predicted porin
VFTIETGVNVDTGNNNGQSNTANSSTGFWASRDSYGGLEGNWGRVSFGRQSIFWTNGTIAQTGANYVNIDAPSATMISMGRIQGVGARFNNTMMYTFPTIGGFGGYLAYSPNSEATLNSSAGTKTNAHTEGVRVSYEGRVKVQADWAANKSADGANGTVTAAKIVGMKLGLGFPYMPGGQISLIVGQNTDHNLGTAPNFSNAGDSVKQRSYVLNWEHIFGPIQALAMYGRVNDASGCTATNAFNGGANGCEKTGASSYLLGARYLHSKRTSTYVTYNKTANSANNCLDYNAAGYTSASATPLVAAGSCGIAPGSDPRIVALGVLHNF